MPRTSRQNHRRTARSPTSCSDVRWHLRNSERPSAGRKGMRRRRDVQLVFETFRNLHDRRRQPIEIAPPIPLTGPRACRFDQKEPRCEGPQARDESGRISRWWNASNIAMRSTGARGVNASRFATSNPTFSRPSLRACPVRARSPRGCGRSGEINARMTARQLARDFARTAAKVEHRPHIAKMPRREVRKSADRQIPG